MNTTFNLSATLDLPFDQALPATRAALAEQGFGIITEIDLAATLLEKIGVEVAQQVILGACRPELAHLAIRADPSIATVLPCNVVVRELDKDTCVVEAFDPGAMLRMSDNEALKGIATDARTRLVAALDVLSTTTHENQGH